VTASSKTSIIEFDGALNGSLFKALSARRSLQLERERGKMELACWNLGF
jgi:hypothetical protein